MNEQLRGEAMEKVSIIVPIYKVEDYLDNCVQSILRQTYRELEIILVDDGSPDRCPQICDEYAQKDDRIRVVHKENGGLGDARNAGVREATGKYLLYVDSDDRIREDLVSITVEAAEKAQADIVIFDYAGEMPDGTKTDLFTFDLPEDKVFSAEEEPAVIMRTCSAVNKLFRREFWVSAGLSFPAGRYYEDLATIPRLFVLAERIVYKKEVLYYYLTREGSITHSSDFSRNFADRTRAVEEVLGFFRERGLEKRYRDELEYLVFENTWFVPSKEIVLNDRKSIYLGRFREYALGKYPKIESNRYVRELSGKNKILWTLLRRKMYAVMVLMSKLRQLRDSLSGKQEEK